MLIEIGSQGFSGLYPGIDAQKLPANAATIANNVDLFGNVIKALKAPMLITTPTKVGTKQSIYRFGESLTSDAQFWFHWITDVNVVRGIIAADTTERTYYTGDGVPKVTDSALALSAGTAYPNGFYDLGIPIPVGVPTLAVSGTGTGAAVSRTYVYTYVSGWGEEGSFSPPSLAVSVQPGQTVTLSAMSVAPVGAYNIATKRIYRAISGNSGVGYQFVAEIPIAQVAYPDTVLDTQLSGVLESATWIPPPAGLQGLTGMRNGMMAGFVGTDVYFCEPGKPWAWPARYRVPVGYKIIGIKATEASLLVTTQANPYIITGTHPQSMDVIKMVSPQSCVSKRSMVDMGSSIMYASPDGMVAANEAGAVLVTENLITQKEWRAFKPDSILGAYYENRYIGFYNTGAVSGGFIIDFSTGTPRFTKMDLYATAAFNDPLRDALFLQVGNSIMKFNEVFGITQVAWVNAVGVLVSGNNLTKTGLLSAWDAGASSQLTILPGEGYVEWTASETNTQRMIGLSDPDSTQNHPDIGWAIYMDVAGAIRVFQYGIEAGTGYGTYATGDVLRVETTGTQVLYKKNGVTFYTSLMAPTYPMIVDSSIYTPGGTLNGVVLFSKSTIDYTWKSKDIVLPNPSNFSAARVDADAYPLTFSLFCDNVLKLTKTVIDGKAFRLPSGFRARTISAQVSGTPTVRKIYLGTSMGEVRAS